MLNSCSVLITSLQIRAEQIHRMFLSLDTQILGKHRYGYSLASCSVSCFLDRLFRTFNFKLQSWVLSTGSVCTKPGATRNSHTNRVLSRFPVFVHEIGVMSQTLLFCTILTRHSFATEPRRNLIHWSILYLWH